MRINIFTPPQNSRPHLLLVPVFALFLTSCKPVKKVAGSITEVADSINAASASVDKSWAETNQNFEEGLGILRKAANNTTDGTVRKEIELTIGALEQATANVPKETVDFTRARIKEDLASLIEKVKGRTAPAKVPYIASAIPQSIQFSSTANQTVTFGGWNLDKKSLAEHFSVLVEGPQGKRALPKEAINSPSQYRMIVNCSLNADTAIKRGDVKMIGKWKDRELFSIPVIQPLPDRETEIEVIVAGEFSSTQATHVAATNGTVGNRNLSSENRRPEPPRVYQSGSVQLKHSSDEVLMKIDAEFKETLPDFTRFLIDGPWKQVFKLLPSGQEVNLARASLNLSNGYANAATEITEIVSSKTGGIELEEHTHDVAHHGSVGCVEHWSFYGDRDGNDDDVKIVIRLNPIKLRIRFRMPDGA